MDDGGILRRGRAAHTFGFFEWQLSEPEGKHTLLQKKRARASSTGHRYVFIHRWIDVLYIYPPAVHPPFPSFSITQTTQLLALYSVTLGLTPGLTFFHPSSSSPFFLIFLWYFLTSWCVSSGFYHHLLPPPPPILQLGPLTCQTGCHCVYLCVCVRGSSTGP